MTKETKKISGNKWPALILMLLALGIGAFVIWRMNTSPRTDDAYVSADTIDVVPEVSGRIVEMAVRDNQLVKKNDVLFRIDPRPFEDELTRAKASLIALGSGLIKYQEEIE